MTALDLAEILKPDLKSLGFKKKRLNWTKICPESALVLNIQKSQWGDEFYINLGVYLTALGPEIAPPHNRCHIRARLEHTEIHASEILKRIEEWFDNHGSTANLEEMETQDQLPSMTSAIAKEYLRHNKTTRPNSRTRVRPA